MVDGFGVLACVACRDIVSSEGDHAGPSVGAGEKISGFGLAEVAGGWMIVDLA